jgi:hypothetical protein
LRLEVIIDREFAFIENSPQPVLKALLKGQLQTWSADISTWDAVLRNVGGSMKAALALTVSK